MVLVPAHRGEDRWGEGTAVLEQGGEVPRTGVDVEEPEEVLVDGPAGPQLAGRDQRGQGGQGTEGEDWRGGRLIHGRMCALRAPVRRGSGERQHGPDMA